MKRMVAFLLATALLFALSGCGAEKEDGVQQTDAGNSVQQTQPDATEIPVETKVQEENTVIATTTEEFMEVLDNYVNLEDYEIDTSTEGEISLDMKDEIYYEADYPLDYTLTMSDGSVITLPCHFQDLVDAGWNSDEESRGEWPANSTWLSEITNEAGQKIEVWWVNKSDTATTDISQLSIEQMTIEFYKENPDTFAMERDPNAPSFATASGVSNESSLKDIIAVLGAPTYIWFSEADKDEYQMESVIYLSYNDSVGETHGHCEIEIHAQNNEIMRIDYRVYD